MSDAEAADLYYLMIAGPLIVVLIAAIVLSLLHALSLHGLRLLPERLARVVGWLVFGLVIGLTSQLLSNDPLTWVGAGAIAAWTLFWARREGRLADAGVALIGGALPWLVSVGLFIVLSPPDPTVPVVDIRFLIVVGALLIAGIGVALVIASPRAVVPRSLSPVQRALLLPNAINRAQAMGPVPAPPVLAFLAGMTGAVATILLAQELEPILRHVIVGTAFIGLSVGVWWVASPRRAREAQGVINWLVEDERAMWVQRLGHRLPRTPYGIRRLLDSLPDVPSVRPLRIEVLATLGRTEEARLELARLPMGTPEERAVEAESADYVGWYEGAADDAAVERLVRELPSIEDPAARRRLRVALAVSRARRAAQQRDPAAIDLLLAVRPEIGSIPSRLRDPGAIGTVVGFVLIGLVVFVLSPLLAGPTTGVW